MSEEMKLVPVEPTKEMLDVAEKLDWASSDIRGNCCNQWQAMLAAAPEPSPSGGMEPVAYVFKVNNELLFPDEVEVMSYRQIPEEYQPIYSADQLATLQAKLEQAEKEKAEFVDLLKLMTPMNTSYPLRAQAKLLLVEYEGKS